MNLFEERAYINATASVLRDDIKNHVIKIGNRIKERTLDFSVLAKVDNEINKLSYLKSKDILYIEDVKKLFEVENNLRALATA